MNSILIDTDVILDFFFDRKPFSDEATQILSLCENQKIKGFITPIMISNIYYILRKTTKHEKVIEGIKSLLNILDIALVSKESIIEALNSDFKDFEDALQNFSAKNQKEIGIIITRNVKDYKTSNLAIMTPENFLKTLP